MPFFATPKVLCQSLSLRMRVFATAVVLGLAPEFASALETVLTAPGAPEDLVESLQTGSLSMAAEQRGATTPQEVIAAAQSDYARMVEILYTGGYYAPVVNILLDGREVADIPPLRTPSSARRLEIRIKTGPVYRFGAAQIGPLAPGTLLPEGFAAGQPAPTPVMQEATTAAIDGWRDVGHAKAGIGDQKITADHPNATLDARITMTPGPRLRFGTLMVTSNTSVRTEAIERIAGFPTGTVYSPEDTRKIAKRLRRTGAFSSVAITEAETANPDDTLDFELSLAEQLPRRISFGGEIYSEEGIDLSFNWTHRNIFGGAERLRFESSIRNLGGVSDVDGIVSLRLDRPAAFGPDYDQFYLGELEILNETNYNLLRGFLGTGVRRIYSDILFAELAIGGSYGRADDAFGDGRLFRMIILPGRVEWDRRNDKVSATEGFYLSARLSPFIGVAGTKSGLYSLVDGRGYFGFGADNNIVLAGRLQMGTVIGPSLSQISPEMLFYSGGVGTVRGQPYQSLGIPVSTGTAGGRSFLGASAEIRGKITEKISLVGFYDFGAIDSNQWITADSFSHSGAGLGLRYDVARIGPIRVDLAYPVSSDTGDGLQFYIGIGQAF